MLSIFLKNLSILKKFLFINFVIFLIIGILTIFYLNSIKPSIIKERSQLMDVAYREDTDIEDRTIDSHVKRIRKKFKKVDQSFSAIETRYGSGYRWNVS